MNMRLKIDWKMAIGFGGLLFLIMAVGFIGMSQIQGLSKVIATLAKTDLPRQNAVLEMKSSNSKYAMGIRNYMFWQGNRYLDAAGLVGKLDMAQEASTNFDKHLAFYSSLATDKRQGEWVTFIRQNEDALRRVGDRVVFFIDEANQEQSTEKKKQYEESINRLLMDFESKLFAIDAFLDDPLQRFNIQEIDRRLQIAETGRQRSVAFLSWSLVIGLFLGTQTAFLIYHRSKSEMKHRELLMRKIIRVEEEERNNLSLQVHDQMGQDLSALKIYLGLIEQDLAPELKDALEKIGKTKSILAELMDKAHNISELLRPPELDDIGLPESIEALVLHYKEMSQCEYVYDKPQEEMGLSSEYSLLLYRVAQEALTNIAKHSQAKHVSVSLRKQHEDVVLAVADDGVGFDYRTYLDKPLRRKEDKVKIGLHGLRERIELFGGRLNVVTKAGEGTKLEVILPIL
ncbi:MAG: sensor histidine kinase [Candidatus Omnitrophota bacterium]